MTLDAEGGVSEVILRDRRHLSDHGTVIVTLAIDRATGEIIYGPDLTSRGFLHPEDAEELFGETDVTPGYLLDSEGNFRIDPVVAEDRADALYQALLDAQNQRLADEAALYEAYLEFDAASEMDEYDEEALDDFY